MGELGYFDFVSLRPLLLGNESCTYLTSSLSQSMNVLLTRGSQAIFTASSQKVRKKQDISRKMCKTFLNLTSCVHLLSQQGYSTIRARTVTWREVSPDRSASRQVGNLYSVLQFRLKD